MGGGCCNSRANKLVAIAEFAFIAANCSLISANNANDSCDGKLFSCWAVDDVDGVALDVAGDTWLRGDGVILFLVPDDMLRSTDPNGIGFDAERTNGNNGFMSNGVCEKRNKRISVLKLSKCDSLNKLCSAKQTNPKRYKPFCDWTMMQRLLLLRRRPYIRTMLQPNCWPYDAMRAVNESNVRLTYGPIEADAVYKMALANDSIAMNLPVVRVGHVDCDQTFSYNWKLQRTKCSNHWPN